MPYLPRVVDAELDARLAAAGAVDEGAEALLRFRGSIDTRKSGEPSVLAVIAGTGFGYVRPNGIAVIPVGSLAP